MIKLFIEFFFSLQTLFLIAVTVFFGLSYYDAKTTEQIKVVGFLRDYEGPWNRIRGGKNEVFLKLYYSYYLKDEKNLIRREESFESGDSALEYLSKHDTASFYVKVNKPFELIESSSGNVFVYLSIMLGSFFLLCLRFYSLKEKRNFRPY